MSIVLVSSVYKKYKDTSGSSSHQKKNSAGAKRDWIGVPGVRNSVTGKTWKLNIMIRIVAQIASRIFFPKLSNLLSLNSSGEIRKKRIVESMVTSAKKANFIAAIPWSVSRPL